MTSTTYDQRPTATTSLVPLFEPRSIALVGASANPASIGGRSLSNLTDHGYPGEVYAVNPFHSEIAGRRSYPSMADIGAAVDLAIVAVPASGVLAAVEDCVASGTGAIVASSAGFAEVGGAGTQLQERLASIARESGVRILGPNCLGLIRPQLPLLASFTASLDGGHPASGNVGFVSQSGAVGSHWLAAVRERGLGLSSWVTTGNEVDVDVADVIEYLATDPATSVIAGYVEGARDGARFRAALRAAQESGKPTILLKVGQSEVGARAAASHTASLVGSDALYESVFRRHGVVRAHSLTELTDLTQAAACGLRPRGRRTGVLTISGGVGVMMADQCEVVGLELPPMPDAARQPLHELCATASTVNPVDTTAAGVNDPAILPAYLRSMLAEGEYDSVVVFLAHVGLTPALTERLVSSIAPVRREFPDRAILISTLASAANRVYMERAGFAVVEDPTAAITTLAKLVQPPVGRPVAPEALDTAPAAPRRRLNELETKDLLRSFDIPVLDEAVVHSAAEAAERAGAGSGPWVMKIASVDIPHKTDIGGVILDVQDGEQAAQAYDMLVERAARAVPGADKHGVLVAPMARPGAEVITGVLRDDLFGSVVLFGAGGTDLESEADVAMEVTPLSVEQARAMVERTRVGRRLRGGRGVPPADVEAVVDVLLRLAVLADSWSADVDSIELNPLLVWGAGEGAVALDALLTTSTRPDDREETD